MSGRSRSLKRSETESKFKKFKNAKRTRDLAATVGRKIVTDFLVKEALSARSSGAPASGVRSERGAALSDLGDPLALTARQEPTSRLKHQAASPGVVSS